MFASPALAAPDYLAIGSKTTTWRAGDRLFIRGGCFTAERMVEVAQTASQELFILYVAKGDCFILSQPGTAILVKWRGGPYRDKRDGFVGSVWEIKDLSGKPHFVWLKNDSGPHRPVKAKNA